MRQGQLKEETADESVVVIGKSSSRYLRKQLHWVSRYFDYDLNKESELTLNYEDINDETIK